MTYVNTSAVAGAVPPPGYPPQGVPPGFVPYAGPPGFPPPGGPPGFAPQGPPPQPGYQPDGYFPYPQSGPAQYANAPNPDPGHTSAPQYPPQSYDAQAPYAAVCFHFYLLPPFIVLNLPISVQPPGPPPGWSPHPDYVNPNGPPLPSDQKHAV
ncbi:hypothetical protein GSI_05227 [Ganoderma sinense ZZ0214-1]|uniref:Uncharacterized protein n=1 Tax=Ganoderma sinense ZZ0214-1 TaxID=1077348 RepID=A0A2G8SFH3_9APHY|nr:hypothetical protein GSI_05227 [Ganoderma sinense ZZ0214-1]